MDRIFISNLCLIDNHGVMPEERSLGQRFYIDIDCFLDVAPAAKDDDYAKTVCYDGVRKCAEEVSQLGPYYLIETLADRIAGAVLERFGEVDTVRVEVRKPQAPIAASFDHVGVEVTRMRA